MHHRGLTILTNADAVWIRRVPGRVSGDSSDRRHAGRQRHARGKGAGARRRRATDCLIRDLDRYWRVVLDCACDCHAGRRSDEPVGRLRDDELRRSDVEMEYARSRRRGISSQVADRGADTVRPSREWSARWDRPTRFTCALGQIRRHVLRVDLHHQGREIDGLVILVGHEYRRRQRLQVSGGFDDDDDRCRNVEMEDAAGRRERRIACEVLDRGCDRVRPGC